MFHAIVVAQVRLERAVPYVLKLLTESQQHDAIERACTIKVTIGHFSDVSFITF